MAEKNYVKVGGQLQNIVGDGILAYSKEIKDEVREKTQEQINTETYEKVAEIDEALESLSPEQQGALALSERVGQLEKEVGYYECSTSGGTSTKQVVADGYSLSSGCSIKVKMANKNTADNVTLKIGSSEAKPLYYAGMLASAANTWDVGEVLDIYYNPNDGGAYYANNVEGGSADGVFDVSDYNKSGDPLAPTPYVNLDAALGTNGNNIPENYRKGGMSIKFIELESLEYKQYRYMGTAVSGTSFTNTANWQGADSVPTEDSKNLVESGGVFREVNTNGSAFNISEYHAVEDVPATYTDLANALGANGANVPAKYRAGGVSVKFILQLYTVAKSTSQTQPTGTLLTTDPAIAAGIKYKASDLSAFATLPTTDSVVYYASNGEATPTYTIYTISKNAVNACEYAQYRYMSTDATTNSTFVNIANWQGVDETPIPGSQNLVTSGGVYPTKHIVDSTTEGEIQENVILQWEIGKSIDVATGNVSSAARGELSEEYTPTKSTFKISFTDFSTDVDKVNIVIFKNGVRYAGVSATSTSIITIFQKNNPYVQGEGYSYRFSILNKPSSVQMTEENRKDGRLILTEGQDTVTAVDRVAREASENALKYSQQTLNASEKQQALANLGLGNGTVDDKPEPDSANLVKSGGIYPVFNSVKNSLIPISGKLSIIGDSISSYTGFVPSGYPTYYPGQRDVTSVYEMWWNLIISITNTQFEVNASYSGSRVTDTDPNGRPDFYDRVSIIGNPDCIFVALGVNDSSNNVTLGDYDYDTPTADLSESEFIPAYTKGVRALVSTYPSAKIVLFIFEMGWQYSDAIKAIGEHYGLDVIDVRNYYDNSNVHPTKAQMNIIAQDIVSYYILRNGGDVNWLNLLQQGINVNLIAKNAPVDNPSFEHGYYSKINGTWVTTGSLSTSDYVKVNPGQRVYLRLFCTTECYYITAFDGNKELVLSSSIKGTETHGSTVFVVPENIFYIRFTANNNRINGCALLLQEKPDYVSVYPKFVFGDFSDIKWLYGPYISNNGNFIPNVETVQVITEFLIPSKNLKRIVIGNEYKVSAICYDKDKVYLGTVGGTTGVQIPLSSLPAGTEYFYAFVRKGDSSDFLIENSGIGFEYDVVGYLERLQEREPDFHSLNFGTAVSKYQTELMAHCSTLYDGGNGKFYVPYYGSDTQQGESFTGNIQCRLSVVNQFNLHDSEIIELLKKGDIVGTFTQSTAKAPYDPNLLVLQNTLRYFMVLTDSSQTILFGYRDITKDTLVLDEEIHVCNITYEIGGTTYSGVPMTKENLDVMAARKLGLGSASIGTYPIMTGTLVEYNGAYYGYLSGIESPDNFAGCIVKSEDNGMSWTVVAWGNDVYSPASADRMWEGAISILNDKAFVFFKGRNAPIAYYHLIDEEWSNLAELMGANPITPITKGVVIDNSRPCLFTYNGHIIAIQNALPKMVTKFGEVPRSRVLFFEMTENLEVLGVKTMLNDASCQYMSVCNQGGRLYMAFTEDKTHRNPQMKGNISIINAGFLDTVISD